MAQANMNISQQTQEESDYHEVEILQSFEGDENTALQELMTDCKKNPEHLGFISVEKFKIEHLPESYRDQLCLDYVMAVISLTVRLVVSYVSGHRPDNYPLSNDRGKHIRAFGSGRVRRVKRKYTYKDGYSCPCPECEKLSDKDKKKLWGEFELMTAEHVVFDEEESRHTQVDVDYNTETDRDTCPKLHGVGVWDNYMDKDECEMYVVSHDIDVCLMLEERITRYKDLRDKLKDKYKEHRESNNPPIVCVSHPHGMSKHVSVGEYRGQQKISPHKWKYTTSTCPGSSGAPICCLGRVKGQVNPGYITQHSRYARAHEYNESGWYGYWT